MINPHVTCAHVSCQRKSPQVDAKELQRPRRPMARPRAPKQDPKYLHVDHADSTCDIPCEEQALLFIV